MAPIFLVLSLVITAFAGMFLFTVGDAAGVDIDTTDVAKLVERVEIMSTLTTRMGLVLVGLGVVGFLSFRSLISARRRPASDGES